MAKNANGALPNFAIADLKNGSCTSVTNTGIVRLSDQKEIDFERYYSLVHSWSSPYELGLSKRVIQNNNIIFVMYDFLC